jgi:hypothetical protein
MAQGNFLVDKVVLASNVEMKDLVNTPFNDRKITIIRRRCQVLARRLRTIVFSGG